MLDMKIDVRGMKGFQRAAQEAPKTLRIELYKAMQKGIARAEKGIKEEAPVISGHLRGRWGRHIGFPESELYSQVDYAEWVHEGHHQEVGRYVPAIGKRLVRPWVEGNPFAERALKRDERAIRDYFYRAIDNTVDKIANKTNRDRF